ncbi:MAG TPA: hypothetical protein VFJ14_14340 [Nocardioidaceae bacterium]|nr:hypothetical protein [Nocardioidaceae bacterium]
MIRQLAYGVCWRAGAVVAPGVKMRTPRRAAAGVPQGVDAGAAEPEPGVASEDGPGLAIAQLQLHRPAG